MTCAIGLETEDGVWIATDSFLGSAEIRDVVDGPKWFTRGTKLVIAYAGDIRAAQIAEKADRFRAKRKGEDPISYIKSVIAEGIRQAHRKYELPDKSDFAFLVGFQGKAYVIDEGYSVTRSHFGYVAIGAGQMLAFGSLFALTSAAPELGPERILEVSLAAAARHSLYTARPFHYCFIPN